MSNTNALPVASAATAKPLVARIADRFGVEPSKMLDTLKATAFRQRDNSPVSNEQMMALLIVAEQYGLNPFTKEIYAFPDKGGIVPVVGVDGWARIVNEHPQFDGVDFEWATDGSECTARIWRKDRSHAIAVSESMAECKRGTEPWKNMPRRMLRHKAFIQAARLAFGFAGIHDEDEAERIVKHMGDAPTVDAQNATPPAAPAATTTAARLRNAVGVASAPAAAPATAATEVIDPATGEVLPAMSGEHAEFVAAMDAADGGK